MEFELVKYNENLPLKIYIENAQNREYHWHKEIELIFVLKGNVIFEVKGKRHKISERDLFFINSLDMHSILSQGDESILLTLQLDPIFFDQYCTDFSSFYYEPNNSLNDRNNPLYDKVTSNLAEIMLSVIKLNTGYKLKAINSAIEIALILLQNFKTENRNQSQSELYKQSRISEILKYIEENYFSDISLDTLSKEMLISPQYISKFFKNNLGVGFVEYVNKLRITKSLNDLLGSKKSILDIAIDYGFNDHKAYNRVFKKELGMTPTEYRIKSIKDAEVENEEARDGYFNDGSSNYFKYLFEFLNKDKNIVSSTTSIFDKLNINANLTQLTGKKLKKHWNKITSIGRAALCLRHQVRNQIKTAQRDIGYEYIRFHGIFSDEMMVYREDSKGNPIYNWNYIDEIFDFFKGINLKPFIEIGFMPEAMASKKQFSSFQWEANMSFPKSLKKWADLVSHFVKHCIERYGKEEVEKWYFEVWSAPELLNIFWFESKSKFFQLYKETYFAIKKISASLRVGSPGVLPNNNFEWFADFLDYCKDNSIVPDFGSSHVYAVTDPQNETLPRSILGTQSLKLSLPDENFLQDAIESMKKKVNESHLKDLKLFVTEWNLSPYTVDYTRDTCFLSAYIIYNVLNNIDKIEGLAFWALSDIIEEGLTESKLYHGGLGLVTHNGIKKPSYNAFYLLNRLGDKVLEKGQDYIITSKGSSFQVLLYNFVYFDELFRTGDKSLLSYHDRYNIFKNGESKAINLILTLESGSYRIKRFKLNRESGSSFDAWLKMGAPEDIQQDVYDFLKSRETPEVNITTEAVKSQLILNDSIPAHGVLLIEIDKLS